MRHMDLVLHRQTFSSLVFLRRYLVPHENGDLIHQCARRDTLILTHCTQRALHNKHRIICRIIAINTWRMSRMEKYVLHKKSTKTYLSYIYEVTINPGMSASHGEIAGISYPIHQLYIYMYIYIYIFEHDTFIARNSVRLAWPVWWNR